MGASKHHPEQKQWKLNNYGIIMLMSEAHEADWSNEVPRRELTPEQGELLIRELKRFELYLGASANWPADLELPQPPRSATYDAEGTPVRLMRVEGPEGPEQRVGWWVSWYEDLELETIESPDIKVQHKHRITVRPDGTAVHPMYERSYKRRNTETGELEDLGSANRQAMLEAFAGEPDNKRTLRVLLDGVSVEVTQRAEARKLEETAGVDLSTFSTERFNKVMTLLAKIPDPAQKLQ